MFHADKRRSVHEEEKRQACGNTHRRLKLVDTKIGKSRRNGKGSKSFNEKFTDILLIFM